jgi:Recombination endonuclease VII
VLAVDTPAKFCPACKIDKPLAQYSIRLSGERAGQAVAYCKTCQGEKQKNRKSRDPSIYRRVEWPSKLKSLYGITVDEYYKMLAEQDGGCAICATKVASIRKRKFVTSEMFFVDHSHATGKVRGLLCSRCNRGLGYFEDSPERMQTAVEYLRNSL